MITVFFQLSLIIFIYAATWFSISVVIKRNDIADIAWGLGYCMLCIYLFFTQPHQPISLLLYVLVMLWGLRLSFHIYLRNRNKAEDFRYREWREAWGKKFYWRSFLQIYLLQGFFLLIIFSPVAWASVSPPTELTLVSYLGTIFWVFGFGYQMIADYQLSVFVRQRRNKNEVMQTGLWKFSRHPNYFGEIVMWWSVFIIIQPLKLSFLFVLSPLTISILLIFVSGVPMLERKYKGNSLYEAYGKITPAVVPKFFFLK